MIGSTATQQEGETRKPSDEARETKDEPTRHEANIVTTSKSIHRSAASLELPTVVPALITCAQGIVKGMTGNRSFPTPTPTLAAISEGITALRTAETAVSHAGPGRSANLHLSTLRVRGVHGRPSWVCRATWSSVASSPNAPTRAPKARSRSISACIATARCVVAGIVARAEAGHETGDGHAQLPLVHTQLVAIPPSTVVPSQAGLSDCSV